MAGTFGGFLVPWTLIFGLTLVWAAATPMFGVPDEVSHMVRAAAAVRGDLAGQVVAGEVRYRAIEVLDPGYIAPELAPPSGNVCYAGIRERAASCLELRAGSREKQLPSSAVSYPPSYYLLVGWPTLLTQGASSLYAMRAVSALIFSALVALAFANIPPSSRRASAYLGLSVAATPMVWFLGASATPSSTAIAAGFATWVGGHRLVTDQQTPPSKLVWRFGLPLCLLLIVRRDSFIWSAVIVLVLAFLIDVRRILVLARSRHSWVWAAAASGCAVIAAASGGHYASSFVAGTSSSGSASGAFGHLLAYLGEMIGVLGWLDTPLPGAAYHLWYLAAGALLVGAFSIARWRHAVALAALLTIIASLIVYFGAQVFPYFQGRYALPAAIGVPILAGLSLASPQVPHMFPRRAVVIMLGLAGIVHLLGFYQQLRRYAVPGQSTWDLSGSVQWQPEPAPILVLVAAHVVLAIALSTWIFCQTRIVDGDSAAVRQAS
ncbi:MAG TPA: DUF2142 domain-containing protein [Acidimicrobiales bacterium]|nr:DUF2142 domain-containing protein [Acidimicrobiales bacterium]